DRARELRNQVQELTEKYNVSAVFDESESGSSDMESKWCAERGKEGCCSKNCSMKNSSIRKVPRPTKAQFSSDEGDSESEEERCQYRRHWVFGKSENRKGKVVPESKMMRKGYPRIRMNSPAPESGCDDDDIPSLEINGCVSKRRSSMEGRVKDLVSNGDETESNSESVEEGRQVKRLGFFGKDMGTKGKIAPKPRPIQEGYPRINLKPEPRKLKRDNDDTFPLKGTTSAVAVKERIIAAEDLDVRLIQREELTMSRDDAREKIVGEEVEKVESDSETGKKQNEQIETMIAEGLDISITSKKLPATPTMWKHQDKIDKIRIDPGIGKESAGKLPEDKQSTLTDTQDVQETISKRMASITTKWAYKGTVKLCSIFTSWQHAINATNVRRMTTAYSSNVSAAEKFYATWTFKARLIQLVPNHSIFDIHIEYQDVVDDTAKKKRIVWESNMRTARPTLNVIGEAAIRDHEEPRSALPIRPQVKELMTPMAIKYYPRTKRRYRNSKRRVRRVITIVSRKRKVYRTYHHRVITSIRAKSKSIQHNSIHQSYLPRKPETAIKRWENRTFRQEIGWGSHLEQSHKITRICGITRKVYNSKFRCTRRNNGKEGCKRMNASSPAVTKEIKNELRTTINGKNSNSDVCTICSSCDIQPSDTPPPWITCRVPEVN
ncbi:12332_t:CDS:2, partial [Acaulospora morrowiae]